MKYSLRNFDNNFQIINSTGWIFVLLSLALLIIKGAPGFLLIGLSGAGLIWFQLRGKRVSVDTSEKIVKSGGKIIQLTAPVKMYMNEVKVSQRVNARVNSADFKSYFYKAYLQQGDEKILLSSNRKPGRDMEKLKQIAQDLSIDFQVNFD